MSRFQWRTPALVLGVGALLGLGYAEAYRFYVGSDSIEGAIVGAQHARRWSKEVWAPGETLVFEIAPDPDFEAYFDSPEGVSPYVERALSAWRDIATADISWRLDGVGESEPAKDGTNVVFLDEASLDDNGAPRCGGYARIWAARDSTGTFSVQECDVALCAGYATIPEEVELDELEDYRARRRERSVYTLVHEFGHCLGLLHAGAVSVGSRWRQQLFIHPRDPAMSYGRDLEEPEDLAADDVVGASLLRPVNGWERRTGSISGSLKLVEEPAPYAHVWALPLEGDPLRDRVGAFSDGEGNFVIEGLAPGDYGLWAQPIYRQGAHGYMLHLGAPTDLDDIISGHLVSVRAGGTVEAVTISMRKGRTVRAPPTATPAKQDPDQSGSIIGGWITPCNGTRIRAERPHPADGPLWFTRRVSYLRWDRWFGTHLTVEWSSEAENTLFEWAGSYRNWWWDSDEEESVEFATEGLGATSPALDVSIADYRIERDGALVRHSMEIAWPESAEVRLRFRSEDDACDGEPLVVCDLSGCSIRS